MTNKVRTCKVVAVIKQPIKSKIPGKFLSESEKSKVSLKKLKSW